MQATTLQKDTNKTKTDILYGAIICLLVVVFHTIYFNKAFPASEGWHITYVKLMQDHKMPYRDFYYYLPPLDLFVSTLFWKLSFGSYLAYRGWRLLERVLIAELLFVILRKRTKQETAMMASVAGALMSAASVYDLQGDYNQTVYLIMTLFLGAILSFLRARNGRKLLSAFVVGCCLGVIFLSKQPHFVASFLVLLAALIWYGIQRRDKKTGLYVLFAAGGTILPLAICAAWLYVNGAFLPFLEQVFLNTDSKGSIFDLIFRSLYYLVYDEETIPMIVICGLTVFFLWLEQKSTQSFYPRKQVQIITAVLGLALVCRAFYRTYNTAVNSVIEARHYKGAAVILLLTVLPAVAIELLEKRKSLNRERKSTISLAQAALFSSVILLDAALAISNFKGLAGRFFESERAFYNLTSAYQHTISVIIIVCLILTIVKSIKDEFRDWDMFFLLAVAFAANYAAKMGTGESLTTPHYYILAVPVLYVKLSSTRGRYLPFQRASVLSLCLLMILFTASQKSISSYRWWGWEEGPVSSHTESLDISGMEGFRVSPETKAIYEEVTKLVASNTEEDSHVLGYPHNVIFNQLANRNRLDRFVPVYFYDVCARAYAEQDFDYLEKNPPDLIVYQNIPYCYDTHANVFQKGNQLAHYEFEEWFSVNRNTLYELVGQISNFYVYKLKNNGISVGYTYYEGVNINTTASVYERFSEGERVKEKTEWASELFTGKGTMSDPYLIASEKDLRNLALAVKSGVLFKGAFFEQTCDIQLNSGREWEPIGEYDSGAYFCGTYNGAGHFISNIRCNRDWESGHSGMFGDLAGVVINLGISDSSFSGRVSGTIASDCYGDASIINCCAMNCDVEASVAAGGIAAYLDEGKIINCYTDSRISVKTEIGEELAEKYQFGQIVCNKEGYGITTGGTNVFNCLSVGYKVMAGKTTLLDTDYNFEIGRSNLDISRVANIMNVYVDYTHNPNFVSWKVENDELRFS